MVATYKFLYGFDSPMNGVEPDDINLKSLMLDGWNSY